MKIGEFGRSFDLTPETVRYYINEGLIVPNIKNARYDFSEKDYADMELLIKLKSFRFTLKDIDKLLALKRLSNLDSPDELSEYISILEEQRDFLESEKIKIGESLKNLEEQIYSISVKKRSLVKDIRGVPFEFLPLLACPNCGASMSLENCNIKKQEIISGTLKCECGYQALIQNGIVIGNPGDLSRYDGADTKRNCYRMMSPKLLNLLQKAYFDISEQLNSRETDNKVVLEDLVSNYCFCYYNFKTLNPKSIYIISDKYLEVVQVYKDLIDKLGLDIKILYISAASNLMPLKSNIVDYYIDFDSSNEYAIFNNDYAASAIKKYLKPDAAIVGAFFHFKMNSQSIKELHRQYPTTWKYCFDWSYFKTYLGALGKKLIHTHEIGTVTDPGYGESFSYHVNNEPLYLSTYLCVERETD